MPHPSPSKNVQLTNGGEAMKPMVLGALQVVSIVALLPVLLACLFVGQRDQLDRLLGRRKGSDISDMRLDPSTSDPKLPPPSRPGSVAGNAGN